MTKRFILIISVFCALSANAQNILFNDSWEFQRLNIVQEQAEIKNQGSDWYSQYDVQHINRTDTGQKFCVEQFIAETQQLAENKWEKISLPHTPHIEPLVILHQWQGVCYYRKQLYITAEDLGKNIWLEFEGAMHLADLWVNGQFASRHTGGYTTFITDITTWLHPGTNEIMVRLDNRNNPLIPPGKPLEKLDFNYYGGLYRNARLIKKNPIHITHPIMANEAAGGGIFVTYPSVSENKATIEVKTHIANKANVSKTLTVRHTLYEWSKKGGKGRKVGVSECQTTAERGQSVYNKQTLNVIKPKLWYPDSPCLYLLYTELLDSGKALDSEATRIGIRHIEMKKGQVCLINGRPYRLDGTNRHQDYPYIGYALSRQAHYRDIWQIRNNGFNIVRLGHYPQDISVLDACDELGLLVIEPIPGWQFFNSAEAFINHTYKDIRDMIRRDRNHPSIIMWETTLNESWPPAEWKDKAIATAHEEYPGDQCYTSGDSYGYDGFDVCYNDWEPDYDRPNKTCKPSFVREYYDYEFGGHYSSTRISRGDGDRALVQNAWNAQWSHNRNRGLTHTLGQAIWSMYDYNRGACDNICHSGLADIFRLPKFSLHYFRLQTPAGSYTPEGKMPYEVFINSHWMPDSDTTLLVYGNVEEVSIELNGKEIARQKADSKPTTYKYVSVPDGGNATNINFPPFTFNNIKWKKGVLKATGYVDGKSVATHTVQTPETAETLEITYMECGSKASQNDVLLVYVSLKDKNGTLCFGENKCTVQLDVLKGGELRCPQEITAEAGTATFVVATNEAKNLILKANSGDLTQKKSIKLSKGN